MKVILVSFLALTSCLAAEFNPRSVYYVQPSTYQLSPSSSASSQSAAYSESQLAGQGNAEGSLKGLYYVSVPEERFRNLQGIRPSERLSEDPSAPFPLTVVTVDQLAQFRQSAEASQYNAYSGQQSREDASNQENQAEYINLNSQPLYSSQLQTLGRQAPSASRYVASIQYSDVEPIPAPIYSYSPQPLTRILRYAPKF